MDVDVESYTKELTDKIEPILHELLNKIELDFIVSGAATASRCKSPFESDLSIFSFVNTCDSCATQDSLFWRRVARSKIVCNECFFTQTYLLMFRDNRKNKQNSPESDIPDDQEPIRKKTRASLKNSISQNASPLSANLKNLNERNSLKKSASSASSTTSSCSMKNSEKQELMEVVEKMDAELDPGFTIIRKSTRFLTNKSKKNENNGKGKNSDKNNKKSRSSPKSEDVQSDKASPSISPTLQAFRAADAKNPNNPSVKSRRSKIFKSEKSQPVKCQVLTSTIFTSDFVFHRGFYMQVGDIVALFDVADKTENIPYFAQIRAFLTNQYGEKSAVLTWLIPTDSNYAKLIRTPKDFDPDMFVLGPAEEYPRSLQCLEFVCRLVDYSNKMKRSDVFNDSYQFKNELQRHKFLLNDLADSNLRLLTKHTKSPTANNSQVEHEIVWS